MICHCGHSKHDHMNWNGKNWCLETRCDCPKYRAFLWFEGSLAERVVLFLVYAGLAFMIAAFFGSIAAYAARPDCGRESSIWDEATNTWRESIVECRNGERTKFADFITDRDGRILWARGCIVEDRRCVREFKFETPYVIKRENKNGN